MVRFSDSVIDGFNLQAAGFGQVRAKTNLSTKIRSGRSLEALHLPIKAVNGGERKFTKAKSAKAMAKI
jgi:hypothetical protein